MKGDKKTVLSPSRCLILCAAAAVAGCSVYLFSVSQAESALGRLWFPFAQIQALTAGMDGETPESVCLVLAALPALGFIVQLLRRRARPEDLLLLVCAGLVYAVMRSPLNMDGLMASETVQPSAVWAALLAWAGLRILRACCSAEGGPLLRLCGWGVCAAALYFAYGAGATLGAAVLILRFETMGAAAIMQIALSLISSGLGVAACTLTLAALRRYDLDGELSSAVMEAVGRLSLRGSGAGQCAGEALGREPALGELPRERAHLLLRRAAGRKARSRAQAAQGRQRPLRLTALRAKARSFRPPFTKGGGVQGQRPLAALRRARNTPCP